MQAILIGAAMASTGAENSCRSGPAFFLRRRHRSCRGLRKASVYKPASVGLRAWPSGLADLANRYHVLKQRVLMTRRQGLPIVIGGDHGCALGIWPALSRPRKSPGLLWIDAHFDSHTPLTSPSLRLHGMVLAILLGEGDPRLLSAGGPAIDAAYTVVFGVRSYESGEPERLHRLGVRYYTMDEIVRRGQRNCLMEAWRRVSSCPGGFGVSLDMDALDPVYAPGVSVKEKNGLKLLRLAQTLSSMNKQGLLGVEIAEYAPNRERQGRTAKSMDMLIGGLALGRRGFTRSRF